MSDHYAVVQERRIVERHRWWLGVLALLSLISSLVIGICECPGWRIRKVVIYAPDPDMARELRTLEIEEPHSYILCTADRIARMVVQASPRVARIAWARKIRRDLSVHILAVPRRPAVAMKSSARARSYQLVDETGFVYAAVREPPPGVPVFVAFPAEEIGVRRYLSPRARRVYLEILAGMKAKPAPIAKVDFTNTSYIVAYLRDGTVVRIGYFGNLQRKFTYIGYMVEAARRRGDEIAYIDVSVPTQPYYVPKPKLARSNGASGRGGRGAM